MAEWDTAYVNDLPDSAFAYIAPGGDKDAEGRTVPRSLRYFPHHDDGGALDLPHLRNALARGPQSDVWPSGQSHLEAHARGEGIGDRSPGKADGVAPMHSMKAAPLDPEAEDAWWQGRIPRRLLAIPFSGPIRFPDGKSRDVDVEYFDERTDIKPDWFDERPTDWHHSQDPSGVMNGVLIGKANNLGAFDGTLGEPDEYGWWVDLWLKAGEARLNLIRRLVQRGAELFGSSYAYPPMAKRGKAGHIDVWPYMMQTLSTAPQNTHSVLMPSPAKAVLAAFDQADIPVSEAVLRRMLAALEDVRDLAATPATGWLTPAPDLTDPSAKAGRELSGANQAELEEWEAMLDDLANRIRGLRGRVRAKYQPEQERTPNP